MALGYLIAVQAVSSIAAIAALILGSILAVTEKRTSFVWQALITPAV